MSKIIEFNEKDLEKICVNNRRYSIESLAVKLKKSKFEKNGANWLLDQKTKRTSKTYEMIGLLVDYEIVIPEL
jgi:hypothetical protein